jgi:hypothetical protein
MSIAIFVVGAVVLRIFTTDTSICAAMAGAAATLAVSGGSILPPTTGAKE